MAKYSVHRAFNELLQLQRSQSTALYNACHADCQCVKNVPSDQVVVRSAERICTRETNVLANLLFKYAPVAILYDQLMHLHMCLPRYKTSQSVSFLGLVPHTVVSASSQTYAHKHAVRDRSGPDSRKCQRDRTGQLNFLWAYVRDTHLSLGLHVF